MNNIERRSVKLKASGIQVRASSKGRTVEGYSPKWNSRSADLGGFVEVFRKGAFTESLRVNPDVLCYFGHDDGRILGRTSSGTLTIQQDDTGSWFSCLLPNTTDGNDLVELLKRGDVNAASFGFYVDDPSGENWSVLPNGQVLREITKAVLIEVSPVGQPAYPDSKIALRNMPSHIKLRDSTLGTDEDAGWESLLDDCTCSLNDPCDPSCDLCAADRAKEDPLGCLHGFTRAELILWNNNQVGSLDSSKERSRLLQSLLLRRLS
jgi:uncharacterized protein